MMDEKMISCGIIEDLIPSYVDEVLSENVKAAVENHLRECAKCRGLLEEYKTGLQSSQMESAKAEAVFVKKLKSARHYLIGMAIGAAIPIVALLGFILYIVIYTKLYG